METEKSGSIYFIAEILQYEITWILKISRFIYILSRESKVLLIYKVKYIFGSGGCSSVI